MTGRSCTGLYTRVAHASHFLVLAEELSTIPLSIETIYHHQAHIRDLCARLFVVTFLLSRLIYGTITRLYTFRAVSKFVQMASSLGDTTSTVFVMGQLFLFIFTRLLNLYWTVLIVRKVNVMLGSTKKASVLTSGVKLNEKAL